MKIRGIKNIKGNYKLVKTKENSERNIQKLGEDKTSEYDVGCFQLVVIDKTPWYKKVIKFIKTICLKQITIKL